MNTSVPFTRTITCGALVMISACGGSDSTSPTGTDNSGFFMTAKIDGASWATSNPSLITANQFAPGSYVVGGVDASSTNITITLANIRGPGTYVLGVGPQVPGGSVILANSSGGGWATLNSGAAGSITISSVSSTEIAGTFDFTVNALTGNATGTKSVTGGAFHLKVRQLVAIGAIPDNAGSTLTAAVGGAAYNAAFVQANLSTLTGQPGSTLTIISSNTVRSIGIILTGVTGAGTYVLGNSGAVTRQMQSSNVTNPASNTWSSISAGSSGSVTITSMTATRVKGTFSGVLGAALSSSGTLTITNGTFDIGIGF